MRGELAPPEGGDAGQRDAAPATVTTVATGAAPTVAAPSGAALSCQYGDACLSPQQFRVAYGIQRLLDSGIDGRGETVSVLVPVPLANEGPTDIRQDLESFDSMFRLPAARIEVVTSLGGSASPWQADGEEVGDFEILHAVAPAATLRVVLIPSSWDQSPANATADMVAVLRLAVFHTDVASISWGLGEHYFTKTQVAQLHSILLAAQADRVTVVGSSGDGGVFPTPRGWGGQRKEVSPLERRPARAGRGRHHAHRESQDRRLHSRDRVERFGWRFQPPVRPSCLSGWRRRDLKNARRARRGR